MFHQGRGTRNVLLEKFYIDVGRHHSFARQFVTKTMVFDINHSYALTTPAKCS